MEISFSSRIFKVVSILRKSKARYALGINIGDEIYFHIEGLGCINYRGGRYSTDVKMFVNNQHHTSIAQGELAKVIVIFELKEVAE